MPPPVTDIASPVFWDWLAHYQRLRRRWWRSMIIALMFTLTYVGVALFNSIVDPSPHPLSTNAARFLIVCSLFNAYFFLRGGITMIRMFNIHCPGCSGQFIISAARGCFPGNRCRHCDFSIRFLKPPS